MPRLHDGFGTFVGFSRLPVGLLSLLQALGRKCFGIYPVYPFIPFSATRALRPEIGPGTVVLEIGSGRGTIWFARHAGQVISIEHNRVWFERIAGMAEREGLANLDLRKANNDDWAAPVADIPQGSIDLLVVDGGDRAESLIRCLPKVRPGGLVYLDNWDCVEHWPGTADFLAEAEAEGQLACQGDFVDFVPGMFGVYRGRLLTKLGDPGWPPPPPPAGVPSE